MSYRDRVYGGVSARTGLNPKQAQLAVDATIEVLKLKMPPAIGRALDAMLASLSGSIAWEFMAPGAKGDKVSLVTTEEDAAEVLAPIPVPEVPVSVPDLVLAPVSTLAPSEKDAALPTDEVPSVVADDAALPVAKTSGTKHKDNKK